MVNEVRMTEQVVQLVKDTIEGLIEDAERYAKFAMKYYKQEQENEKTKS